MQKRTRPFPSAVTLPDEPLLRIVFVDQGPGLQLIGELDIATAPQLMEALAQILATRPASLHLDCSRLDFIDSSGIHAILNAVRDRTSAVTIYSPSPPVARAFSVLGLNDGFGGITIVHGDGK